MDGRHLVAQLRRDDQLVRIPVMVLSAWRGVPPPGAVGVLHKPFDSAPLLRLVAQHLTP
jgi:CheY-like chemotaxis protein